MPASSMLLLLWCVLWATYLALLVRPHWTVVHSSPCYCLQLQLGWGRGGGTSVHTYTATQSVMPKLCRSFHSVWGHTSHTATLKTHTLLEGHACSLHSELSCLTIGILASAPPQGYTAHGGLWWVVVVHNTPLGVQGCALQNTSQHTLYLT